MCTENRDNQPHTEESHETTNSITITLPIKKTNFENYIS